MSILESRISGFFGGGGGGGGLTSVQTDNLTIRGDGTIASPLHGTGATQFDANVDLSLNDFTPPYCGTFIVNNFGGYIFYLPTSSWGNGQTVANGQRITIINSQQTGNFSYFNVLGSGGNIKYQGTNFNIFIIPSGMTYEFVFNSAETVWYCYNVLPNLTTEVDLDNFGTDYEISASGIYNFINNIGNYGIYFNESSFFNGLKYFLTNNTGKNLAYVGATKFRPSKANGTVINTIPSSQTQTIISMGNSWNLVAVS